MNALNWKTTVIGVVGAIIYAVLPLVQGGQIVIKDIVIAAVVAAIGYFSKDKDVTGTGADAVRPSDL